MKEKLALELPVVIILLSLYVIGLRIYQNRVVPIEAPTAAFPMQEQKSEEEEDAALHAIADKININTATESELTLLDGIGETLAERIIAKREELGAYTSIEQLREVDGIGTKIFDSIKGYIKVE